MTDQPKWTPGPWRKRDCDVVVGQGLTAKTICHFWRHWSGDEAGVEQSEPNANLTAAAPDLYSGGEAQTTIIRRAQAILTQYLIPDGIDGPEAINQLLDLLDGPDQRAAQSAWDAALAKARGEA